MKEVFTSERIRFVELSEALVGEYLRMVNDMEHVGRLIGRTGVLTEAEERAWIEKKRREGAPIFSMLEKNGGAFIGNIDLRGLADGIAEFGIAITADKQDQGYGTEATRAFLRWARETIGLRRVWLRVYPDNFRAIRVYEKCGFREIGRNGEDLFMEQDLRS